VQRPRSFRKGCTCGQDVVDNDAAASGQLRQGAPADTHGPPHPPGTAAAVQAFLASGQLKNSGTAFFQHLQHGKLRELPWHPPQEQVDRAEATLHEGSVAGGHWHQAGLLHTSRSCPDSPTERPAQAVPEPMLAVPFERQEGLRQLLPVHAGSHHRQQHRPADVHQGGSSLFSPEGLVCQPADVALARNTQRTVFGSAAHTVHWNQQRQEIATSPGSLVHQAQQRAPVIRPVPGGPLGGRHEVRIGPKVPWCAGWASDFAAHPPSI
jgi:hypothetical protein